MKKSNPPSFFIVIPDEDFKKVSFEKLMAIIAKNLIIAGLFFFQKENISFLVSASEITIGELSGLTKFTMMLMNYMSICLSYTILVITGLMIREKFLDEKELTN